MTKSKKFFKKSKNQEFLEIDLRDSPLRNKKQEKKKNKNKDSNNSNDENTIIQMNNPNNDNDQKNQDVEVNLSQTLIQNTYTEYDELVDKNISVIVNGGIVDELFKKNVNLIF